MQNFTANYNPYKKDCVYYKSRNIWTSFDYLLVIVGQVARKFAKFLPSTPVNLT